MKPVFSNVKSNFSSARLVKQSELFAELGWHDLAENPAYENTCAIRMSLALIKCGINIPGRMRVKAGTYKGIDRARTGKACADSCATFIPR